MKKRSVNFAKLVREILRDYDLTEAELARMVGAKQPTIHRLKHGLRQPGYEIGTQLVELHAARPQARLNSNRA
jgi:hypothetical protein